MAFLFLWYAHHVFLLTPFPSDVGASTRSLDVLQQFTIEIPDGSLRWACTDSTLAHSAEQGLREGLRGGVSRVDSSGETSGSHAEQEVSSRQAEKDIRRPGGDDRG